MTSLRVKFSNNKNEIWAIDKSKAKSVGKEIEKSLSASLIDFQPNQDLLDFLANSFVLSPYLCDCALINPANLIASLCENLPEKINQLIGEAKSAWKTAGNETELMQMLRNGKKQISLILGLADLSKIMQPWQITDYLSQFADGCLSSACNFLLKYYHDGGKLELQDIENPSTESGLIVLGMGKYGAGELNYSSDIDIILFIDLSAKIKLNTDDPTSLFVRFAKQLSRILQERTGDGYVFRTDLRLRPDPGSTPLVIPVETAFNYYEAYGQNWERAAFIKARAVAGDTNAGAAFLKELSPFIWRKYLDFAAIQDVHSIKRQIHAYKGHGEIAVKGHNVKLGRGGIREIEFFVQTQQLIAGGRREQLRVRGTIEGLDQLAADGWITQEAATTLAQCYWYLRDVEHRIQMVADEQSHTLPEDDAGLSRIAAMMACPNADNFSQQLTAIMKSVEKHYSALFEASPELSGKGGNLVFTGDDDDPQTLETLSAMGFVQPSQIIATVKGWHYGRFNAVRTPQARELLTELTPSLMEAFSQADNPDTAFFSFDRFLGGLPAGIQLFSIMKSNSRLTALLTRILGSAPRLSEIITRRPHIFDGLIDPSFGAAVPEKEKWVERLSLAVSRSMDYESKLDQIRIFAAEQKFLIGIRLINRTINARQAGHAYSDLADILLNFVVKTVCDEFEKAHGTIEGGEIAVLGMGRLGSRDLTASSDLDLIFLYRHPETEHPSNGAKQLYPQQYFVRLVQRLITATSAPTSEGILYELDFRLRPSGNAGPLATHFDSFCKYQENEAWIWESQALVRARVIAGNEMFSAEITAKIPIILQRERQKATVSKEVLEMRKTLDTEKSGKNHFDVKRMKGGLIDIEFIAQWAVLTDPKIALKSAQSTLSILDQIDDQYVTLDEREVLKSAYSLYNSVLQIVRLCLVDDFDPEKSERGFTSILTEQTSLPDLSALKNELVETAKSVRAIFLKCLS